MGAGVQVADLPDVRRPQRPRHRGAARGDVRGGCVAGWCWPPRWWSTARAATPAPSTAISARRLGRRRALDAGVVREPTAPSAARPLTWELVDEDARLDPRSVYAASKVAQEHYASAWVRQADASAVALRYHNVYGPGMPRDTPYSGVAAMFRSSLERGEAPQVFEDGGQMRDFVHVEDVARANVAALPGRRGPARPLRRVQRVLGRTRSRSVPWPSLVVQGAGSAVRPEVTGRYRLGDVRHVVASPARASAELGFTAAISPDGGAAGASRPRRCGAESGWGCARVARHHDV